MTATEIQALKPGDSIIGAFDSWDDELPIQEVLHHFPRGTQITIRVSRALVVPYFVLPDGPEMRGLRS